ncbi:PIN domain-containing protein [Streptomyces anthocyanicus]|uniref:PIN domain-containing protein n=1 Tax=Streptomyces TaxID=1883 RepID=UPI00087D98B7|nr:PIN domain-containing protein [Streptomyces sp. 2114.2]REH25814.1 hypothetical protein BX268_7812 [Streptomyces sp. 2221.1]SDT82253.1 hypothetical protein SAMN05428941_7803 [Streptomyces sp. 2114.2]
MIILDTCIIEKFALHSTSSDLLKTIRTSGADVVAVPSVVMDELVAHRVVPHRRKHEKATALLQSLAESTPWPERLDPPRLDLDRLQQHWRDQFGEIVDVVETSAQALRTALHRETNVLPPSKEIDPDGKAIKTGSRDAAIWLTAVEYAREHEDETVYFVSDNTGDFGDGSSYPYPMDEDLKGIKDRFVHLTSLTEVVERFATRTSVSEDEAREPLEAHEAQDVVAKAAWETFRLGPGIGHARLGTPFEGTVSLVRAFGDSGLGEEALESLTLRGFLSEPRVRFSSIRDIKAHRLGDHVWCAATAEWLVSGLAVRSLQRLDVVQAGTVWGTRVLFSTTEPTAPLTVLRPFAPRAATATEFANMPDIPAAPDWSDLNRGVKYLPKDLRSSLQLMAEAVFGSADTEQLLATYLNTMRYEGSLHFRDQLDSD